VSKKKVPLVIYNRIEFMLIVFAAGKLLYDCINFPEEV